MNALVARAAEHLPRRSFTVDDLDRMVEAGVIAHDDRIELIGGDLIPMAAKGNHHEVMKSAINRYLGRHLPDGYGFTQEAGWRIDQFNYVEPDFVLYPDEKLISKIRPADALLVIEVANTSLGYDRGFKSLFYADLGISEYWVVDAVKRETHVHRNRTPEGWSSVRIGPADEALQPLNIPGVSLRLSSLRLDD